MMSLPSVILAPFGGDPMLSLGVQLIVLHTAVAVTIAGEFLKKFPVRAVGKVVASTGFVLLALPLVDAAHARWVLAGLVLSWIGDVLLLADDKRIFLAGLVAFLVAHLAYAAAFLTLGPSWSVVGITALMLAVVDVGVLRWLGDRAGKLTWAVRAYVAAISVMVALAAGAAASTETWGWLVAAVSFMFSDLLVARQRFIVQTPVNRLIGLPPYYGAQILFALAVSG